MSFSKNIKKIGRVIFNNKDEIIDAVSKINDSNKNKNSNFECNEKNTQTNNINKPQKKVGKKNDTELTDSISETIIVNSVTAIKNPIEALNIVSTLINTYKEISVFEQIQKTERANIRAERDTKLAVIESKKQFLLSYLDKTFDERKMQFNNHFKIIDTALSNNNIELLQLGLNAINKLASESPFKNLKDLNEVRESLNDKNTEWEF